MSQLLNETAARAGRYLDSLKERRVSPDATAIRALDQLSGTLPDEGSDPTQVIAELDEIGSPATVASNGGRYFGFVIGSALPVATAADWLATVWNQNNALTVMSPVAQRLEAVATEWIRELLALPPGTRGAFVTGDTMANLSGLAAGRHAVLAEARWDVEREGLTGAPPITVVVGQEVHISVLKALALLGLGRERVVPVPTDDQGRMRADELPSLRGPAIVCLQAGNVNSGAFDPAEPLVRWAHDAGAWVHVDGAFGLWARASREKRPLTLGFELADSWATDGHKWLNVPYDCGIVYVRQGEQLRAAMSGASAAYLPLGPTTEPMELAPEMSRRARGVPAWAALRSLGRQGVEELIDRTCGLAKRFADRMRAAGYEVLNEVVLNQVLVSFGTDSATERVIRRIPEDGTCWAGGTTWHGRSALRFSVSSHATSRADIDRSAEAIVRLAASRE